MRATTISAALAMAVLLPAAAARSALADDITSAAGIIRSLRLDPSRGGRVVPMERGAQFHPSLPGVQGRSADLAPPHGAGVRHGPAAGQAASAQPAAAPQTASDAMPSVNLTVRFANDSADLTPAAVRALDELGKALRSQELSGYRFRVEGHTDAVGPQPHNQVLSQERAAKVVEYLASKFDLDRAKLEAAGLGSGKPLVPSPANVSEPRNRRVTIVNLGA